jgi:hypothetical protein
MLKLVVAALIALAIWRMGRAVLRALARPAPEPPPPGEMRKVNLRFRCSICGSEVRMMLAPDEDPDPPRHCLEEMSIVAPIDD